MDALHRILSGSPDNRKQLVAGGLFVMFWFAIDLVEWVDWLAEKINPPPTTVCLPLSMMMPPLAHNNIPGLPTVPVEPSFRSLEKPSPPIIFRFNFELPEHDLEPSEPNPVLRPVLPKDAEEPRS